MITRLRVKNYKSLKDLDLRLRPLNVFVGPNGAGKSNILDVLELLSDLINLGAGALHSRGTFDQIVWNGEIDRVISIALEGDLNKKDKYSYEIQIAGSATGYSIAGESFTLNPAKNPVRLMEFDPKQFITSFCDETGNQVAKLAVGQLSGSLRIASTVIGATPLPAFAHEVSQWCRFRFDSRKMKELPTARRELRVGSSGENIALVLHTLQTEYPDEFERITEALQVVLPSVHSISTPLTEQGRTLVRVRENKLDFATPIWSFSDGTLHGLALLTALNVPAPPQLMSFEEPENFVHPRVLQVLTEEFKGASEHSQINITTHSPYLVDYFEVSDIIVVENERGATKASRIPRKKGLYEALEALGLGEAWYSGSIGGVP